MVYSNKNNQGKRQGSRQRQRSKAKTLFMQSMRDKDNRLEEDIPSRSDARDAREEKNDADRNVVYDKPSKVVVPRSVVVLPLKGSHFAAPHPSIAGSTAVSHSKYMKDTKVSWSAYKMRIATDMPSDNAPLAKLRIAGRLATTNFRDELVTILGEYLHLKPVVERHAGNLSSKARGAFADSLKNIVRDRFPTGCIFVLDAGFGPKGRFVIVVFPYWYVKIPYTMEALSQWDVYFASQRVDVINKKSERKLPEGSSEPEVPIGTFQMISVDRVAAIPVDTGVNKHDCARHVACGSTCLVDVDPVASVDAPSPVAHVAVSVDGAAVRPPLPRVPYPPRAAFVPSSLSGVELPLSCEPGAPVVGGLPAQLTSVGTGLRELESSSPGLMSRTLDWLTTHWESIFVVLTELHAFSLVAPENRVAFVFNRIASFLIQRRGSFPSLVTVQTYLLQIFSVEGVIDVASKLTCVFSSTSDVTSVTPQGFLSSLEFMGDLSLTALSPGTALHAVIALAGSAYAISHLKTDGVSVTGVFTALFRTLGFLPRTDISPNDAIAKALIYVPVIFAGVLTAVRLSSLQPLLQSGKGDQYMRIVEIISVYDLYSAGQIPNSSFKTKREFEDRLFNVVRDCEPFCRSGDANVMRVWSKLKSIQVAVLNNIRGSPRPSPYVICLYGGTASGKTSLLNNLINLLARESTGRTVAKDQIFVVNSNDKFLSGAHSGVTDIVIDDAANAKASPGCSITDPAAHLIQFNNNIMTPATMAGVEEKGRIFLSPEMVYVTTNVKSLNAELHSNAPISIVRRVNAMITVLPKAEFCFENTRMLDPGKIPRTTDVSIPNLWNFKVECARSYPNQGPYSWVDMGFPAEGSVFDLVRFLAVRVKAHRDGQTKFVASQVSRGYMDFSLEQLEENHRNPPREEGPCAPSSRAPLSDCSGLPNKDDYARHFAGASACVVDGVPVGVPQMVPVSQDLPPVPSGVVEPPIVPSRIAAFEYPRRELHAPDVSFGVPISVSMSYKSRCARLCTIFRDFSRHLCLSVIDYLRLFVLSLPALHAAFLNNKSMIFYCIVGYLFGPLCFFLCLCEPLFVSYYPLLRLWCSSRTVVTVRVKRLDVGIASLVAVAIYWLTRKFLPKVAPKGVVEFALPREAVLDVPLSQGNVVRTTTTIPQMHSMLAKRVFFCRFFCGTVSTVGVVTPLCTNFYALNWHVLSPLFASEDYTVVRVEFCRSNGVKQALSFHKRSVFHPPGVNDVAIINVLGPKEGDIRADFIHHDMLSSLVAGTSRLPLSDSSLCLVRLPHKLKTDTSCAIGPFAPLKVQCLGPCISMKVNFGEVGIMTVLQLGVSIETVAGDCGSPLSLSISVGGTEQVLLAGIFCGTAVSRGVSRGIFAPLTKETIAQACLALSAPVIPLSVDYQMPCLPPDTVLDSTARHPLLEAPTNVDKMFSLGVLKKRGINSSSLNTFRSEIVRGPGYDNALLDEILGVKQHEFLTDTTSLAPYNLVIQKICDRVVPMPSLQLASAISDAKVTFASCIDGNPKVLSIFASINGTALIPALKLNTAAGLGFPGKKLQYFEEACMLPACSCSSYHPTVDDAICPGKNVYYYPKKVLLEEVHALIGRVRSGGKNLSVFRAALKDDVTAVGKKKIRVFFVGQMAMTIVSRMYYAPLFSCISSSSRNECAVGMDVHSQDWDDMENYLDSYNPSERLGGDYSSYDLSVPSLLMDSAFSILAHVASLVGWNSEELSFLKNLSTNFSHPVYVILGQVFSVAGTMASGMSVTAQVNSLMNSLIVRGAFYTANPGLCDVADAPCSNGLSRFQNSVSLITYGDDVKGAVRPVQGAVALTNFHIRDFASTLGMVYGSVDKSLRELPEYYSKEEITFLKCTDVFVPELGRRMGSLSLSSIRKCLAFARTQTFEARISTAQGALRLFFPFVAKDRDHVAYERLRQEIVRITHLAVTRDSEVFDARVVAERLPCYVDTLDSLRSGVADSTFGEAMTGESLWSLL